MILDSMSRPCVSLDTPSCCVMKSNIALSLGSRGLYLWCWFPCRREEGQVGQGAGQGILSLQTLWYRCPNCHSIRSCKWPTGRAVVETGLISQ